MSIANVHLLPVIAAAVVVVAFSSSIAVHYGPAAVWISPSQTNSASCACIHHTLQSTFDQLTH